MSSILKHFDFRKGIDNILPTLEAKQLLDFTNSVLQHLTEIDSDAANKGMVVYILDFLQQMYFYINCVI